MDVVSYVVPFAWSGYSHALLREKKSLLVPHGQLLSIKSDITAAVYRQVEILGSHLQGSISSIAGVQNGLDTWCPQIQLSIVNSSIANVAFMDEVMNKKKFLPFNHQIHHSQCYFSFVASFWVKPPILIPTNTPSYIVLQCNYHRNSASVKGLSVNFQYY